jgi:peroxiredoxin
MKLAKTLLAAVALSLLLATAVSAVKVGDTIPQDVDLHFGFPPENINLSARFAGKKVILVGLPGAFTPTCSTRQVPGYLESEDALKKLGIDEVIVFSVNDGAVMSAWAMDQKVPEDSIIKLMGDPYAILTEKLDMELTHAGPKLKGLVNRCKRHALYIVNGTVEIVRLAEKEDDPAGKSPSHNECAACNKMQRRETENCMVVLPGDDFPDVTLVDSMIEAIKELRKSSPKEEL